MRGLDGSRQAGHVHDDMVCCVGWACVLLLVVYIAGWVYACMYMMTGWSPGMYYLAYGCMHVCVFSMFLHRIIIITVMQGYNFGAMSNRHLQRIISLKVPEHDVERKQVRETYLVAAVCV